MKSIHIYICFLMAFFHNSYEKSSPISNTYRAAVMEYKPIYVKNNGKQTIETNTANYVEYIKKAGDQDVDIIVFPEDGLTSTNLPTRDNMDSWTTVIPSPSDNHNPCIEENLYFDKVLQNISCAARSNNIYVVINIAEKLPCTGVMCPEDNTYYYNTNVVFDRLGNIIARYRKTNLFLEAQFNKTPIPEIVTFDTDFGVKFGTFICFDILFEQPATNLTRDSGVTDIVFPTAWFSELPFLTAVQTQLGWSYAEDVNFLASGYNHPIRGNSGSGIYLGRNGIGKAILPLSDHYEMLIVDVPKKNSCQSEPVGSVAERHCHSDLYTTRLQKTHELSITQEAKNELVLLHESLNSYNTVPFNGNITETLCHNGLCCVFNIKLISVDPTTHYRLAVFNGRRIFVNVYPAGIKSCAVVQCSDETTNSCGSAKSSDTVFELINITGQFKDYRSSVIMPSTLSTNFMPLQNFKYTESKNANYINASIYLTAPQSNIFTFGIYARAFKADH